MRELLQETLNQPLFWLALSVLYFRIGQRAAARFRTTLINPMLTAVFLLAITMALMDATLADYNAGGQYIALFLTPVTVSLAVPIYRRLETLKQNWLPILCGALAGSVTSIVSVLVLCRLFGLTEQVSMSLLPKSVTTPIGIRISQQLGGIPSLTAVVIVITGIFGGLVLPGLFRLLRIKDPVAVGVAMGTTSHAFGTARALELGETEGAMSSLALGVAGVLTAILAAFLPMLRG